MKWVNLFLLLLLGFPAVLRAQQPAPSSDNGEVVVEVKAGAQLNWNFGKKKQFLLAPSLRSVHNNRNQGNGWAGYQGMEAEIYFSMPVLKYLSVFVDAELDLINSAQSHYTFNAGVKSAYSKGRFSVGGELKFSTDRDLHFADRERDPFLKYRVNGGVYVIEKIWKFTAQVTVPHCLAENAIKGINLEGISAFTINPRFGINVSFEWSDTFATGGNRYCPQVSAVFSI